LPRFTRNAAPRPRNHPICLLYLTPFIPNHPNARQENNRSGSAHLPVESPVECKRFIHRMLHKLGGGKFSQNSAAAPKIPAVAGGEKCGVSSFRRVACNSLGTGDAKGVLDISGHETASVEKTKTDGASRVCGTSQARRGWTPGIPSGHLCRAEPTGERACPIEGDLIQ